MSLKPSPDLGVWEDAPDALFPMILADHLAASFDVEESAVGTRDDGGRTVERHGTNLVWRNGIPGRIVHIGPVLDDACQELQPSLRVDPVDRLVVVESAEEGARLLEE